MTQPCSPRRWLAAVVVRLALLGCLSSPVTALLARLNADNFHQMALSKDVNSLILFFAPWCGHCKEVKPNYAELARDFTAHEKVLVGFVDCTQHRPVCVDQGITGYPTIKYYIGGETPTERTHGFPASNGIYDDWHSVSEPSGLLKIKDFVTQVLGEGVAPPPRSNVPPPPKPPPTVEKAQQKRPAGWWKNPEKWKSKDSVGEHKPAMKGINGLDISMGMEKPTDDSVFHGDLKDLRHREAEAETETEAAKEAASTLLNWTPIEVVKWLRYEIRASPAVISAAEQEEISGAMLGEMDKEDWKSLGASGLASAKIVAAVRKLEGGK